MKLINRINPEGGDQTNSLCNGENSNGDNDNSMSGEGFGVNNPGSLDESSMNYDDQNDNSRFLLSDYGANGNDPNLLNKQKRRHGDKALYLQEPQFVTKRTSSGRLVKMKINTEFDYASDEEREAKKKRRETIGDREGIQLKHIRNNPELENTILSNNNYAYMSSSEDGDSANESERSRRFRSDSEASDESDDDDDDEFMASKKRPSAYKRKTNRPYTRRKEKNERKGARRTIKQLQRDGLLGELLDEEDEFESGGEEGIQRARRGPYVSASSINSSLYEPNSVTSSGRRRLNGQMTVGQALAAAQAQKQLQQNQQSNTVMPGSALQINPSIIKPGSNLVLKVPPGSNTGTKLTVPTVNPALKDALDKYNQQKGSTVGTSPAILSRILNPSDPSQKGPTVKLIAFNPSSPAASNGTPVTGNPKKIFIMNPGVNTSNGQNLVKLLTVNGGSTTASSESGAVPTSRYIMIKTPNSTVATNGNTTTVTQLASVSSPTVKNMILNSQLSLQKALAMGAHPPPLTPTGPPTLDTPSPLLSSSILQEQQSNIPPAVSTNVSGSNTTNGHGTTDISDQLVTSVKEIDSTAVVADSHHHNHHPIAVEASQN